MSLLSRIRHSLTHNLHCRHLSTASSILSPDCTTPLTSKQKTRAALNLLKSEQNPHTILDICRAAALTPYYRLDQIALNVAVSQLSGSKNFESIRELLESGLRTRPELRTERFVAHSIVLYGRAGMVNQAIEAFKQMGDLGIRRSVKSLNALLFACLVAKDYKELNRVFVEFPKVYGLEPDLDSYNTVIKGFSESGSTSSGYSVVAEMERNWMKPSATTFGHLFAGFYREERFEDIGKVMKLMKKHGVDMGIGTYNIRIQGLCKLKKSSEAKALLDGMLLRGLRPNSVTYAHLIQGFCNEGNLEQAKKLFKTMKKRGCQPDYDCYSTMVCFLCQGGDIEAALSIAKESMEKGWLPNFVTMKGLVEGLVGIKKVEEARELIKQIKEKVIKNVHMWDEIEAGLPQ
ncbi:small ribosomal subunit protein mS86 (rPPR1)-like [Corylus avellana]|uniref:small ribosomal subunit protein mS86 (rPPR1)-like n=1 Tax=Corylus avellana TaxID=13451 RepID=UPI001E22322F|nr:small ribosomal subunit protein mS86 (rPPR1)-like [Corylus avellana]